MTALSLAPRSSQAAKATVAAQLYPRPLTHRSGSALTSGEMSTRQAAIDVECPGMSLIPRIDFANREAFFNNITSI